MPIEHTNRKYIIIVPDKDDEALKNFIEDIETLRRQDKWRCLYTYISPQIGHDPYKRNIILNAIRASFEDADRVKIYWLTSGYFFFFFKGPVRAVINNFEKLLGFINEESGQMGEKSDYHFFWELSNFWGYFDQILASAINKKQKKQKNICQKSPVPILDPELQRQRKLRYKPMLLIVEDDRVTRHLLQAIMEKYCDIIVAWNAEQAKNLYQTMLPNITFLDIELPDGDGRELAELFCGFDKDSFIVMVSGALSSENTKRCLSAGVKGAVKKPIKEQPLLNFVDQYHKSRRAQIA